MHHVVGTLLLTREKNQINKWFDYNRFWTDLNLALCGFCVKSKHSFYHISLKLPFSRELLCLTTVNVNKINSHLNRQRPLGLMGMTL